MKKMITKDELKQMRKEVDEGEPLSHPPEGRDYWDVNRIVTSLETTYLMIGLTKTPLEQSTGVPKGDGPPPLPPKGCAHKFVHIEAVYGSAGGRYRMWRRVDRFFCERCLEPREIQKEELSERSPEWWARRIP